jgi:hypothetical protein
MIAVTQRQWMVADREQELHEKEEEVTDTLERRCGKPSSCEADLYTCEAALELEQKRMGELRVDLLARELTVDLQANH